MSERVRADVREFWSTLPRAQEEARAMLFSLRETSLIAADCAKAAAEGRPYQSVMQDVLAREIAGGKP
jgi:predicted DNA binding CopG/RHH family protein